MATLNLGQPPIVGATDAQKIDWIIQSLRKIQIWSVQNSAFSIADDFTITGLSSELRSLNCTSGTLAQLLQVVGTIIEDWKARGSKRTT